MHDSDCIRLSIDAVASKYSQLIKTGSEFYFYLKVHHLIWSYLFLWRPARPVGDSSSICNEGRFRNWAREVTGYYAVAYFTIIIAAVLMIATFIDSAAAGR